MDHADRGLGRVLPDRVRAVPRLLRGRGPPRRARSDRGALLRRSRADRADRLSRGELLRRDSATIPNTRRPCCGCRTNRWSARRAPTTTTSPSAGSSCSRCRKSPRATTRSLYTTERLEIAARDGTPIPVSVMYRKDRGSGGAAAPLRLRRLRHRHRRRASRPPGSAWSTAASPMPSRISAAATTSAAPGTRPASSNAAPTPSPTSSTSRSGLIARGLHRARADQHLRRLGRRRADGRGDQLRSRAVGRGGRARAVRRRAGDDARRLAAADPGRMARMGQSDRGPGRVRADPPLFSPTTTSARRPIRRCWSPPASTTRA